MNTSNRYQIVEYEAADDELKAIYDDTMKTMGTPYVLNWFKCQGGSPILLNANWQKMKMTLLTGQIPMLLKQMILYKVSKERGCKYCTFVHGMAADSLSNQLCDEDNFKVSDDLESAFIPSSYKTATRIVSRCALDPTSTTDEDFEELRDEGFSDSEIQELMAQADLINMLNTIADISGIEIDRQLLGIQP